MKVTIISTVLRNGKFLAIGKAVDLPEDEAQALIDAGAAEAAGGKAKPAPAGTGAEAGAAPGQGDPAGDRTDADGDQGTGAEGNADEDLDKPADQ